MGNCTMRLFIMQFAIIVNGFEPFVASSFEEAENKRARAAYMAEHARNVSKRPIWAKRAAAWKSLAADILSCKWR
jgi:hypothetical protein